MKCTPKTKETALLAVVECDTSAPYNKNELAFPDMLDVEEFSVRAKDNILLYRRRTYSVNIVRLMDGTKSHTERAKRFFLFKNSSVS